MKRIANVPYISGGCVKQPSQPVLTEHPSFIDLSNGVHFLQGEAHHAMRLASCVSILGAAIAHIRQVCSKEKVGWINALPVIAGVKHKQIIRYGSIVKQPRGAAGRYPSGPPNALADLSVSSPPCGRGPIPAFIRITLDYLLPKPIRESFGESLRFEKILSRLKLHKFSALSFATLSVVSATRGHFSL